MRLSDRISAGLAFTGIASLAPPAGPLILMYHGLGGDDGVAIGDFRSQLELLRRRRKIVSLFRALDTLDTPEAPGVAAVTFDDGYRDFAELAWPILAQLDIHATVFVPAGHVGGSNQWDTGIAPPRPLMSATELRQLDAARVEIGVHGMSHRRMIGLDPATLEVETVDAKQRLEDECGRKMRLFAYPYGQADDFDLEAESAVRSAGFAAACSTRFGRGSREGERYRLRRVGVDAGESLSVFERKLDGAHDWTAWKEALGARLRRARARMKRLPTHGPE